MTRKFDRTPMNRRESGWITRGLELGDAGTPCGYATHPVLLSNLLPKQNIVGVYPGLWLALLREVPKFSSGCRL